MKIRSIDVRGVKVPMAEPHYTASGVIAVSPLVLIRLETDQGVTGQAVLFAYTEIALKSLAEMVRGLAPLLEGQELAPITLTDQLLAKVRLLGAQGPTAMAIAGLDMAMWDALAQSAERPLFALLGAAAKPIKPYGAVGFEGEVGSARTAEALAKKGFQGVKAKIGYPTVAEDLAVIRAMRSAVGPDVAVMVDYNQSLDATEAARRLGTLANEDLVWIEEPVPAHDFAGLAGLRGGGVALQAGENWWGPPEFKLAVDVGATELWMPDVMKCHGITGWMRVAGLAAAMGIPISNHLWSELSAQMMCAAPTSSWLEYCDWWNPILEDPLRMLDGLVDFDQVTATGVRFDETAVGKYLM
ncbi:MAG: enolase C-terminal domain-like protein [Pseudomonadota bacterium]